MQASSDEKPTPPSHLAAIVVAAVVAGLLFFAGRPGGDESDAASVRPDLSRLPVFSEADRGGRSGPVALLEDYVVSGSGLDSFVTDRVYEPRLRPMEEYGSPLNYQAASAYLAAIGEYKSSYDLKSFGDAARHLAMTPPDPNDRQRAEIVRKFTEVPGGRHILEALGNPRMLMEFSRLTAVQIEKLKAREAISRFAAIYRDEWHWSDGPEAGDTNAFAIVPEDELLRRKLRQWELQGPRYFICYAGNSSVSRRVASLYPGRVRPVYENGLNAVLDPVRRRFKVIAAYWPNNNPNATNNPTQFSTLLAANPDGPITVAEFNGALPRARLYADWETETDPEKAEQILFSPGFDPQRRALVRVAQLPEPEAPAGLSLPAIERAQAEDGSVRITIPAVEHNVVLLLNEPIAPEQSVTLDGAPVQLLPANLSAAALHLPASEKERSLTISAAKAPADSEGWPLRLLGLIALALVIVFVIQSRRRPAAN